MPTYSELKGLLLKRKHDLNAKMYWWKKPAVDSLSSLDFADLIVLGKIDHYFAEGTDQPWYCFGDMPEIKNRSTPACASRKVGRAGAKSGDALSAMPTRSPTSSSATRFRSTRCVGLPDPVAH
jgi:hypothetical protein